MDKNMNKILTSKIKKVPKYVKFNSQSNLLSKSSIMKENFTPSSSS